MPEAEFLIPLDAKYSCAEWGRWFFLPTASFGRKRTLRPVAICPVCAERPLQGEADAFGDEVVVTVMAGGLSSMMATWNRHKNEWFKTAPHIVYSCGKLSMST